VPQAELLPDRAPGLSSPDPRPDPAPVTLEETIMQRRPTALSLLLWLSCLGLAAVLLPSAAAASPFGTRLGTLAPAGARTATPTPTATAGGAAPDPETTAQPAPEGHTPRPKETVCDDGKDNDGDTVFDCGDADCKDHPACQPDGKREYDEARCSDWIDNDNDGYVDCDDFDCEDADVCKGSWDVAAAALGGEVEGVSLGRARPPTQDGGEFGLRPGETPEDLLGRGADNDGERDNYTCSDGIDNDNDGKIDCADLGCKLDTAVTVCQGDGDFRFSVVARLSQSAVFANDSELQRTGQFGRADTQFDAIQMRVLGQLPFIQNSFFLLSMRAERTPRMTFATFQVPLGQKGHYVNVNSGGGGLSLELVRSVHKRMLADPAFYVYNAFEQGNGAAVEFGGPMDKKGKFLYRSFIAGGAGRFNGNIGGRFFPDDNRNYTWSAGAQAWMNLVGYYSRWDSPFLYTPAPTTFVMAVGAKYDQRAQERYPAANLQAIFRWRRLVMLGEVYAKRELNFKNWQVAYNVQAGVLAVKKRLFFAADAGQYVATDFEDPPPFLGSDLRRQLREFQYRVAGHVYLWRQVFFATLVFRDRRVEPNETQGQVGVQKLQDLRLLLTYRW
jgi:hypothetical protein